MHTLVRERRRTAVPARRGRLKAKLLATVFLSASLLAQQAAAQQIYVNADGTRTNDLAAAAATWATLPAFVANPALAGLNAQYAYAMGVDGSGVKLGLVDTSVAVGHPDLVNSKIHPLTTTGTYTKNGVFKTSVAGQPFTLSATDLTLNVYTGDFHGTAMSGFIAASGASNANGSYWPRGVAPGVDLYVAHSIGQNFPSSLTGVDGAVLGAGYDALIAAGARAVNGEWQITQTSGAGFAGVAAQYRADPNNGALLGMQRAAAAGAVVLMPGGNQYGEPVGVGAALPNFVAGLERSWIAVVATSRANGTLASYSDICGQSKWWCVTATAFGNATSYMLQNVPLSNVSLVPSAGHPVSYIPYNSGGGGGTSEASADALAAMGLVMARFPYMTSQQARDVLLTTASPVGNQTGVSTQNGFGLINLRGAMQGPGQFLGAFQANLPTGTADTWTNSISEAAITQRMQEYAALQALQVSRARAQQLIADLQTAIANATDYSRIAPALEAAQNDPIAKTLVAAVSDASAKYKARLDVFLQLHDPATAAELAWRDSKSALVSAGAGLTSASVAAAAANSQTEIQTTEAWMAGFGGGPIAGSLVKSGGGVLTLTGTNTFTGGVTLAGGTLSVSGETNLGARSGGLTFNGGILQITGTSFTATTRSITWGTNGGGFDVAASANIFTVAQPLTGAGGMTKLGAGTLALAGANTYSGPTLIAAGTLEARGGRAIGDLSAVTVAAGAALALRDSETIGSLAGGGSVALGSARLTAGGNDASTLFAGFLSGTGGLTKAGLGTLTLTGASTYAGGTTIAAGTLQIGNGGTTGSIVGDVLDNATLAFNRSDAVTFAGAIAGTGSLNQIGTGTLTLTGANTYAGGTAIAAGTLEARGGRAIGDLSAVTVAAGAALALRDSETIGSLAGGGSVALGSARLTAGGNDASTLFAGFLSGAGGLTKAGLGTLTLTGANTYAGGTAIAAGTLQIGNGGTTGSIVGDVLDNAALAFNRSDAVTFAGTIAGTGSLNQIGTGTLTLTGASTFTGGTAIAAGTLQIGDGGTTGSIVGDVLDNAALAFNRSDAVTFAGTIAGTGNLNQIGTGTLTLTGANTYAGGTAIAAGTLQIGNGGTTGSIVGDVLDNATLAFNRSDAVTFAGTIAGTGSLNQIGTGTLTLTGASTYAGRTTVAAGGLALTSTASLVSPVLTLAGATLTNAGRLAGGLDNAGTTTTSGLVAGGVTNTGTFTATAGQVNGPIRNLAGRFDVTGAVSSDAAFANATGAALTVSGDYSLAGLLTNAGTLTVAAGARLAAAGVDNAGVLTVAAEASVIDALNNTGFVNNAGTYTADASNAAGATLINTGTFSTVSQPFANAGALMTTGVLNGGLTNSGTVQAAGQLNGAVANTGLIQLTGTTTGITRLTNDGAFDLGATALSVGSLAGSAAAATLGNGRLTAGADGSSTTYAGRIVDGAVATGLTKVGGGTLTLAGDNVFTGPLTVLGGELAVTGTLSGAAASLGAGSLLSGQATFASLTLGRGGTVAPGAGPGTVGRIAVTGDLGFAPGATYQVDATADGRSDRIVAGGRATLAGAAVQAIADTGQYAPRTRYAILTAGGGLSGQFAGVTANFAFLTPFLGYDANAVYLTLARNDLDFAAVAVTRNQRGAAAAVQAGAVGSPLYDAVATLSAGSARAAFAALSGDAHASLVSTAFATAGLLREAVLDRLRWDALPEEGMDYGTLPAAYTADGPRASVPARVLEPQVFTLWGQGFGSTGRVGSDGNAAALSRTTSGFMFGADARLEAGLQLGLAGGYRTTSFASPGTAEAGTVDGVFGGLYGGYRIGPVAVRFGALAADDAVSLRRLVLFPGFSGTPSGRTGGTTVQGFGEVGYQIDLGARPTAALIEPFVGGAAVAVRRDRFTEQGGPAALGGAARGDLIPAGTVGVRGQTALDLGPGVPAVAHGLVGYRHAFGDVTPIARETILGTGASFVSAGLPIDRDALVAEAGLSIQVAANAVLGVAYTGQVGSTAQDHTAKGNFTLRW